MAHTDTATQAAAQTATQIKSFIQDNYSKAQHRLVELADRARHTLEEKGVDGALRLDLRDQLGVATAARVSELEQRVQGLQQRLEALDKSTKKKIQALEKKLAGRKATPKSTVPQATPGQTKTAPAPTA